MVIKKIKKKEKAIKPGKKKDATLIITEKPQAAAKIAAALSGGTDDKITDKDKVSYYEFDKNGKRFLVGCAVGHIYGIQQKALRGPFPNFDVEWRANYEKKKFKYVKKYFDVLKKLTKKANNVIVACDYDIEGEVIGWNIVRFLCKKNVASKAKRAKFSSLTKDELEKAFSDLEPTLNWGHAFAGETRHFLDWFYGINLSRGLMKALSKAGKFRILSIGRVQGPALKIVVDKEKLISAFIPKPFWQVFLQIRDIKKQKLEVKFPKDILDKKELLKFKHLKNKNAVAETKIKNDEMAAPVPFDLATLQTESYRHFGLTPSQTLRIAQQLYLGGLISYPRTSSQEYPEGIGYDKILKRLKKYTTLVKYVTRKIPTKGKKTDPAHPAIYPTGEIKKFREQEKKIYDLIVKRFISCFCDNAKTESRRVVVDVDGLKFHASGVQIKEKNWLSVYPTKVKEAKIPIINGVVDISEIRDEEKMTKHPQRYSAASLMKELEKKNLGTKSTRANIIETLYSRGYVREKAINVTPLGMIMAETLEKHSPIILDDELTKKMEIEMEEIQRARTVNGLEKKEKKILEHAKKVVTDIAKDITKNIDEIGKSLAGGSDEAWKAEKEAAKLGVCPVCKKGSLTIKYGRQYKRYFVACDAYPECKTTFPLPPKGKMIPAKVKDEDGEEKNERCKECGFPMIISLKKGGRPWKFCFNPECPSRKEYEKNKGKVKKKVDDSGKKVRGS